MVLLVDLAETGLVDVCVELGGGDVGVAEEFLDDAEVGAAVEEMCGKGVAECVGVHVGETCAGGDSFDDLPDGHAFEGAAVAGEEESSFVEFLGAEELWAAEG